VISGDCRNRPRDPFAGANLAIERDTIDSDTREDPISITKKRTNVPDERVTSCESSRECSTAVTLSVTQKCNKYLKNVEKTLKNKDVP